MQYRQQFQYRTPKCTRCKKHATGQPRWRRFKNGSVHLVWWCCGKQCGDPIPKREASSFGLESYEQAVARLTVEHDQTWPSLKFDE
jgi:hypothetical protein